MFFAAPPQWTLSCQPLVCSRTPARTGRSTHRPPFRATLPFPKSRQSFRSVCGRLYPAPASAHAKSSAAPTGDVRGSPSPNQQMSYLTRAAPSHDRGERRRNQHGRFDEKRRMIDRHERRAWQRRDHAEGRRLSDRSTRRTPFAVAYARPKRLVLQGSFLPLPRMHM